MEGIHSIEKQNHSFMLPDGTEFLVNGTRRGSFDNPTISGEDAQGRKVTAVFENNDGVLVPVSVEVDGETIYRDTEELDEAA